MDYVIRRREKQDCASIAHITTVSWNETYKGIVSDDFLNGLYQNEEKRIESSINTYDENNNHTFVLEVEDKVVGFVKVGKDDEENYGEIQAIYILKEYQGYGFGKKLIDTGINELKRMNFNKMIISCLVGNPSNDFYEHIGGKLIRQRIFERLNLPENVYLYEI